MSNYKYSKSKSNVQASQEIPYFLKGSGSSPERVGGKDYVVFPDSFPNIGMPLSGDESLMVQGSLEEPEILTPNQIKEFFTGDIVEGSIGFVIGGRIFQEFKKYVPITRKINGYTLDKDLVLALSDLTGWDSLTQQIATINSTLTDHQEQITQEVTDRKTADNNLQEQINTLAGSSTDLDNRFTQHLTDPEAHPEIVDKEMSGTSNKPIANRVVKEYIDKLINSQTYNKTPNNVDYILVWNGTSYYKTTITDAVKPFIDNQGIVLHWGGTISSDSTIPDINNVRDGALYTVDKLETPNTEITDAVTSQKFTSCDVIIKVSGEWKIIGKTTWWVDLSYRIDESTGGIIGNTAGTGVTIPLADETKSGLYPKAHYSEIATATSTPTQGKIARFGDSGKLNSAGKSTSNGEVVIHEQIPDIVNEATQRVVTSLISASNPMIVTTVPAVSGVTESSKYINIIPGVAINAVGIGDSQLVLNLSSSAYKMSGVSEGKVKIQVPYLIPVDNNILQKLKLAKKLYYCLTPGIDISEFTVESGYVNSTYDLVSLPTTAAETISADVQNSGDIDLPDTLFTNIGMFSLGGSVDFYKAGLIYIIFNLTANSIPDVSSAPGDWSTLKVKQLAVSTYSLDTVIPRDIIQSDSDIQSMFTKFHELGNNQHVTPQDKKNWNLKWTQSVGEKWVRDNFLALTGGTITGNLVVNGTHTVKGNMAVTGAKTEVQDLVIHGNVTQEGDTFISQAQEMKVSDNTIVVNNGETGSGVTKGTAGIEVDRGTAKSYFILFDESDDRFKVGTEGDLWPVMLRDNESSLVNGNVLVWDSTTKRAKTGKNLDTELGKYLPLAGGTMTGAITLAKGTTGDLKGIVAEGVAMLAYTTEKNIVSSYSRPTTIRSSASDLTHTYGSSGTEYKIWDARNLPDPMKQASAIEFTAMESYVAARFYDSAIGKKAFDTYIEWWQSGAGWFNFQVGSLTANGNLKSTGLVVAKNGVQLGDTTDIGWYNYNGDIAAGMSTAKKVLTGSLLVSSSWADRAKVPANGIYSSGNILSNSYFLNNHSIVSGNYGFGILYTGIPDTGKPYLGLGSAYSTGYLQLYCGIRPKFNAAGYEWVNIPDSVKNGSLLELSESGDLLLKIASWSGTKPAEGTTATPTSYPVWTERHFPLTKLIQGTGPSGRFSVKADTWYRICVLNTSYRTLLLGVNAYTYATGVPNPLLFSISQSYGNDLQPTVKMLTGNGSNVFDKIRVIQGLGTTYYIDLHARIATSNGYFVSAITDGYHSLQFPYTENPTVGSGAYVYEFNLSDVEVVTMAQMRASSGLTKAEADKYYYPLNGKGFLSFDAQGRPVISNNQGYCFKNADGTAVERIYVTPSNVLTLGGTNAAGYIPVQIMGKLLNNNSNEYIYKFYENPIFLSSCSVRAYNSDTMVGGWARNFTIKASNNPDGDIACFGAIGGQSVGPDLIDYTYLGIQAKGETIFANANILRIFKNDITFGNRPLAVWSNKSNYSEFLMKTRKLSINGTKYNIVSDADADINIWAPIVNGSTGDVLVSNRDGLPGWLPQLEGNMIQSNTDLNTLTKPRMYYCPANATVATLKNCPTTYAFSLMVLRHAGIYQRLVEYTTSSFRIFSRNYYDNTWGEWEREDPLNSFTLSQISDLHANWDALLKAAPLWDKETGYPTLHNTGNEINIGSSGDEIYVNYRGIPGEKVPTDWKWMVGPSTVFANGYWGNLYMSNKLVATQEWVTGTAKAKSAASADTASKLTSAKTITFTGDATGSFQFDGSANKSVAMTVGDSSKWSGKSLMVVTELPSSPAANTIYMITE